MRLSMLMILLSTLSVISYPDHAHKGNIEKHTKSGGLYDWAKKKFFINHLKPAEQLM